jgi:uncharacterized protein YkwD
MIWFGTTTIGCALLSADGNDYLICGYRPRGAVVGKHITGPTPDQSLSDQVLQVHNLYRAAFGSPLMSWSSALATQAAELGNRLSSGQSLIVPGPGDIGYNKSVNFNVWNGDPGSAIALAMVESWANWEDASSTDIPASSRYSSPETVCDSTCSSDPYAQMIWWGSTQIGCALFSANPASNIYVDALACAYSGRGNVLGMLVTAPTPSMTMDQQVLAVHNSHRAEAGTSGLVWSSALVTAAKALATKFAARTAYPQDSWSSSVNDNSWSGGLGSAIYSGMVESWTNGGLQYERVTSPSTNAVGCAEVSKGAYNYFVCSYTVSALIS